MTEKTEETKTETGPKIDPAAAAKSTEEKKAAEAAANEAKAKEEAAVAAAEAKEAAIKAAKETEGDLPKEETEEEESEGEKETEAPLDTDKFGDAKSEVGNSVLRLLQNAGATPEDAKALLFDAVQKNDMSLVDQAKLTELVGEANTVIIMNGAQTFANEIVAKSAALETEVTSVVGSKETWTTIQDWAEKTDSITDAEVAEYNGLLELGGASARFAATELLAKYNADKSNTQITDTPRISADVDTSSSSEAISAKEYYARMDRASRTGEDTAPIRAARARGRKKGL